MTPRPPPDPDLARELNAGDYANWLQPYRDDGAGVPIVRQRPAYVLRVGKLRALIAIESLILPTPKVMTRIVPLGELEQRRERPPFNYSRLKASASS